MVDLSAEDLGGRDPLMDLLRTVLEDEFDDFEALDLSAEDLEESDLRMYVFLLPAKSDNLEALGGEKAGATSLEGEESLVLLL